MSGHLSIISIPIGNEEDITVRALRILKEIDMLICEEYKFGKQILRLADTDKELFRLNEHNVEEGSQELIDLLKSGKHLGLISDCGTPVFSDPGLDLVRLCHRNNISITTIPGASSLMPALVLSGFDINKFKFFGWLPRKQEEREKKLKQLNHEAETVVIMETPYRFNHMLESLYKVLDKDRLVAVCCDLTSDNEEVFRDTIEVIYNKFKDEKIKREFVLLVGGRKESK